MSAEEAADDYEFVTRQLVKTCLVIVSEISGHMASPQSPCPLMKGKNGQLSLLIHQNLHMRESHLPCLS